MHTAASLSQLLDSLRYSVEVHVLVGPVGWHQQSCPPDSLTNLLGICGHFKGRCMSAIPGVGTCAPLQEGVSIGNIDSFGRFTTS